ncbi:hypothetical protein RJT34_18727 [Clitoria ternatea]|uniref:Uncharacterized protein n=1 Tax=Clitoria ternatea TaxID=43366 RepID=A0AAN9JBC5_CLITE
MLYEAFLVCHFLDVFSCGSLHCVTFLVHTYGVYIGSVYTRSLTIATSAMSKSGNNQYLNLINAATNRSLQLYDGSLDKMSL